MNHCRTLLDEGRREEINLCSRCDAYKDLEFEGFEEESAEAASIPVAPAAIR